MTDPKKGYKIYFYSVSITQIASTLRKSITTILKMEENNHCKFGEESDHGTHPDVGTSYLFTK